MDLRAGAKGSVMSCSTVTEARGGDPSDHELDALRKVRHVALDLDGTLYCGATLFHYSPAFLETLQRLGIGRTFLTNNSSKDVAGYLQRLRAMGIEASADEIRTSTHSAIEFIREEWPRAERVFIAGSEEMSAEFAGAGFDCVESDPQCVVVGFDPRLSFECLCRAGFWIQAGVHYIATHPDRTCPTSESTLLLDCGALTAALRAATGRAPDAVLGKPHPRMLWSVLQARSLKPREVLVTGDRMYTDIAMGRAIGAQSALVLSGESTAADAAAATADEGKPDFVFADLAELGGALTAAAYVNLNRENSKSG